MSSFGPEAEVHSMLKIGGIVFLAAMLCVIGALGWNMYAKCVKWSAGDDEAGRLGVSWTDRRFGGDRAYFGILDAAGGEVLAGVDTQDANRLTWAPDLAWNGEHFGVAWFDPSEGAPRVKFARFTADGVKVADDTVLSAEPLEEPYSLSVTANSDGWGAAWSSNSQPGRAWAWSQSINTAGGRRGNETQLREHVRTGWGATIAWGQAEHLVVTPGDRGAVLWNRTSLQGASTQSWDTPRGEAGAGGVALVHSPLGFAKFWLNPLGELHWAITPDGRDQGFGAVRQYAEPIGAHAAPALAHHPEAGFMVAWFEVPAEGEDRGVLFVDSGPLLCQ